MDSPKRPVRCLFPQEQSSVHSGNMPPVPVHQQENRVSAADIKVHNTDDSLMSSDDSGTDTLHIALEDSSSDDIPRDLSAANNKHKDHTSYPLSEPAVARIPLVNHPIFAHSSPLISEYPRPAMSFFHAPPPASLTSLHSQFPSTYTGFHPYQPPVFQPLHAASSTMTLQHPTETSRTLLTSDGSDDEGNGSDSRGCSPPSKTDQTSPANSFTSSGVYSNRSSVPSPAPSPVPSPIPSPVPSRVPSPPRTSVLSPLKAPVANKRPRAPGGRTCYAPNQVRAMEKAFMENKYPDYDVLEKMSAELEIPVKKMKVWFQNKRARCKSRYPDMPAHNMAASMSAVGYGYLPGAVPLPFTGGPHMMPVYPGYPYPGMYPPPVC